MTSRASFIKEALVFIDIEKNYYSLHATRLFFIFEGLVLELLLSVSWSFQSLLDKIKESWRNRNGSAKLSKATS